MLTTTSTAATTTITTATQVGMKPSTTTSWEPRCQTETECLLPCVCGTSTYERGTLNRFSPSVSVEAPRNLRERQREGVRQELRAAALGLFARDGYAATSVDDIVREAGVSRSTFFRYFGSKEALLLREAEESTGLYLELLAGRPAPEDRLEALEESLIDFAEQLRSDERREEAVLANAIIESDASLRASQEVLRARYRHGIARVLAERGGRSQPDIEDVLASAILGPLVELMTERWMSSDDAPPARDLIRSQFASLRSLVTHSRRPRRARSIDLT